MPQAIQEDLPKTTRKARMKLDQGSLQKAGMKRYNLVIPNRLFDEVQQLADDQQISVLELLRRFIKLGLVITKLSQGANATLIIREDDRERELVLI